MKQSLIRPLDAWQMVGITPETPVFLVQSANLSMDDTTIVCTYLVGSVELLLQLLEDSPLKQPMHLRVHVIHETELEEVLELWEYQPGCPQRQRLFAYVGHNGELKPYYSWQELPAIDRPSVKLAHFGNSVE